MHSLSVDRRKCREFDLAPVGRFVRFTGTWLFCLRKKAERDRSSGLWGSSHGVSVFYFECHPVNCHGADFQHSSILRQDLIHHE